MVNWLKFFFLSYFTNRYAREAADRRFLNLLLGFALSIVLIFGGLATGYRLSFGAQYANASEFKEFAYAAFAGDSETSVSLSVDDGVLTAIPPAKQTVDSFASGEYSLNGYMLIIDSRPEYQTYAEFDAYYSSKDGAKKLAYPKWLELTETDRAEYPMFGIEYKPTAVDIQARRVEYESYFDGLKTVDAEVYVKYAELKEKSETDEISMTDYECALYELYVTTYYPSLADYERYGNAPTLKTYYLNTVKSAKCAKYLVMFRDEMYASFATDDGILVQLDGKYGNTYSCSIVKETPKTQARAMFDGLISSVFERSIPIYTAIYMINVLMALPWMLLAYVACVLLLSIAQRIAKLDRSGFIDSCKTVGSFLFISGVIAFVFGWLISYFVAREASFQLTILAYVVAFAIRTVIYAVTEIIRSRKRSLSAPEPESASTTQLTPIPRTSDPFASSCDTTSDGQE